METDDGQAKDASTRNVMTRTRFDKLHHLWKDTYVVSLDTQVTNTDSSSFENKSQLGVEQGKQYQKRGCYHSDDNNPPTECDLRCVCSAKRCKAPLLRNELC